MSSSFEFFSMHDIKWIRDNPEAFDARCTAGLAGEAARLIAIDERPGAPRSGRPNLHGAPQRRARRRSAQEEQRGRGRAAIAG